MLISMLLSEGDITSKLIYVGFYIIAIVISFTFHEWAHAHAAYRMGDSTARNMGRMTLDPTAHIDPIGFIMILLVGFGWAKPVPVNPNNYRDYRKGEFIVSFAGIFTNLIIALISAFLLVSLQVVEIKAGVELPILIYTFLNILGTMNVCLAVFNFIPVFPLDGSHIFDLLFGKLVGAKVVMWMHNNGRIILYVIFGLSFILSRMGISLIGGVSNWLFGLLFDFFAIFGNMLM